MSDSLSSRPPPHHCWLVTLGKILSSLMSVPSAVNQRPKTCITRASHRLSRPQWQAHGGPPDQGRHCLCCYVSRRAAHNISARPLKDGEQEDPGVSPARPSLGAEVPGTPVAV